LTQAISTYIETFALKSEAQFEMRAGISSFVSYGEGGHLYSLPLLKMIERGLFKEFDAVYEVLRDLLLTWEFI